MTINSKNQLIMTVGEYNLINQFAVTLASAGILAMPWQCFGFSNDLANAAITLSTLTANAEQLDDYVYAFDLTKEIYGSEYEAEQGFAVDDVVQTNLGDSFLSLLEKQAIEDSVVADISLVDEDKKRGWD